MCQQWSSWDCPQLWRRLLKREEARVRGVEEEETDEREKEKMPNGEEGEGEKLKTDTKKLWQLRAAWKKAECETARIEVGFSIEI